MAAALRSNLFPDTRYCSRPRGISSAQIKRFNSEQEKCVGSTDKRYPAVRWRKIPSYRQQPPARISAQAQVGGNRDKKVKDVTSPPSAPAAPPPAPLSSPSASEATPAQEKAADVSDEARATDSTVDGGEEAKQSIDSIGAELAKIREERGNTIVATKSGFWTGVLEETQMIEWPAFSNVLGTTGVVVGVIVGSSVVLLTLNAVLASLSDQLLANPAFAEFWRI